MALVAYDNSDSSEYEDEDNEKPVVILNKHIDIQDGKNHILFLITVKLDKFEFKTFKFQKLILKTSLLYTFAI